MSSVSPILVKVSSSICLRMTAGSTNRSARGTGMRSRASAARLVPPARLGRMAVAGLDGQHRAALAIGPDRLEQPAYRGHAVRRPYGGRIRLGTADGQVAQLGTKQLVGLAGENPRHVAVVLHNAPVIIDAENEGAHRRGEHGCPALGADAFSERPLGFGYAILLGVHGIGSNLGFVAWPGAVACAFRGPRGRGALRRGIAVGDVPPDSAALRRHARRHVLSPDGTAGCALVNYGPRTARSDRSSDDSP